MSFGRVQAVIFDVDGVLLDARTSYHAVAEEAARRATGAREAPFDRAREIPAFKAAGRFNDDWEMTRGISFASWISQRPLDKRSSDRIWTIEEIDRFARLGRSFKKVAQRALVGIEANTRVLDVKNNSVDTRQLFRRRTALGD